MSGKLRGVFPIVYTPFKENGDVDEEDLRQVIDYLIASGVHGLAGVGGASESHKLTSGERKWMAEVTIDQARGRVPVIIGTSAENTRTAVDLSRHAEKAGALAVFLTPPTYGPPDPKSIRHHYAEVARAITIPIFIQHAGIPVPVGTMVDLARESILPDRMRGNRRPCCRNNCGQTDSCRMPNRRIW